MNNLFISIFIAKKKIDILLLIIIYMSIYFKQFNFYNYDKLVFTLLTYSPELHRDGSQTRTNENPVSLCS